MAERELDACLTRLCDSGGRKRVATLLDPWLPHRVGETLLALTGTQLDRPVAEFAKADRRRLLNHLKRLEIPISGTMGFRKAELTAGGVALDEIDPRTMQSRIVPNLYFAGELLDLNGPVGGYNSRPLSAPAGSPAKAFSEFRIDEFRTPRDCARGGGEGLAIFIPATAVAGRFSSAARIVRDLVFLRISDRPLPGNYQPAVAADHFGRQQLAGSLPAARQLDALAKELGLENFGEPLFQQFAEHLLPGVDVGRYRG